MKNVPVIPNKAYGRIPELLELDRSEREARSMHRLRMNTDSRESLNHNSNLINLSNVHPNNNNGSTTISGSRVDSIASIHSIERSKNAGLRRNAQ